MLVKTCFFPLAPKKIQMNSFGISIAPHLFRTLFDFNNYFLGAFDVDFFLYFGIFSNCFDGKAGFWVFLFQWILITLGYVRHPILDSIHFQFFSSKFDEFRIFMKYKM